jgi:MoxR-vWA-beta-propeller ternary system domain bpX5
MNSGFVTWAEREPPLVPCAVAATGDVARRLAARLLELDRAVSNRLFGVAGQTTLVVLGEEADLPWVDGVSYLGQDPTAPGLLLPTHVEPIVPAANLLERALRKRFVELAPPLAVLPATLTIVSCQHALQLVPNRIEAWLREVRA